MVYVMEFYVDGDCRGNDGSSNAVGAAACCLMSRSSAYRYSTRVLPRYPHAATNQRAEITAIIMALEWALKRYEDLDGRPRMRVRVRSDSRYAVECMNTWIHRWTRNGWRNAFFIIVMSGAIGN